MMGNYIAIGDNTASNPSGNKFNKDWVWRIAGDYALVLALLMLAVAVRVYQFGFIPGGFNQDEAMSAYDGYLIARYGMDRSGARLPVHFYAWGYGQQSAFMIYAMVPFIWAMGLSVVSTRLPILIFSLLGLFAMYWFTEDAFKDKRLSIAVLAVGAINPWHIMQSRWALDCNMFPHLMMIGCWFLYKGLVAVKAKRSMFSPWLAASMIFFAFCLYSYGIALYTMPVFLFIMTVYLLVLDWKLYWKPLVLSFIVFLVFAWPMMAMVIVNYFELPSFSVLGITIPSFHTHRMNELLFFHPAPRQQLVHNARALSRILLQQDDFPWNVISGHGTLFVWSIPFTSLGLFSAFKIRNNMGKIILLFWLAMAVFAGLVVGGVNVNRGNIIFYPLIVLTGIGMYEAVMIARKLRTKLVVLVLLVVISASSFTVFARSYFGGHGAWLEHLFYGDFFRSVEYAQAVGYDRLYVTTHTHRPDAHQITEVMLLFGAQVNPTTFFDDSFRETYRIIQFYDMPDPPELGVRVLYLFHVHEAHLFPSEIFDITWVDRFGVARFRS